MNVPDFLLVLLKFLTDKISAVNVKIISSDNTRSFNVFQVTPITNLGSSTSIFIKKGMKLQTITCSNSYCSFIPLI